MFGRVAAKATGKAVKRYATALATGSAVQQVAQAAADHYAERPAPAMQTPTGRKASEKLTEVQQRPAPGLLPRVPTAPPDLHELSKTAQYIAKTNPQQRRDDFKASVAAGAQQAVAKMRQKVSEVGVVNTAAQLVEGGKKIPDVADAVSQDGSALQEQASNAVKAELAKGAARAGVMKMLEAPLHFVPGPAGMVARGVFKGAQAANAVATAQDAGEQQAKLPSVFREQRDKRLDATK